jgi:hypothetical protein
MKVRNILFLAAGIVAVVGCGAAAATPSVSSSTPTPSVSSSTPTPVDVAGAQQAALGLFVETDPGHWGPCIKAGNYAACPLSVPVKARLADLYGRNYFYSGPGGHCSGDYIIGTTNPLFSAPKALSAIAANNGSVTVVIQRAPSIPVLTAVMTNGNDTWLATDLATGTGPSASIFSAKPNC